MAKIRIENTTDRLLTLGSVNDQPPFRLIPGGTNMDKAHFEAIQANPNAPGKDLANWIELGWIRVDTSAAATKKPEGPEPLKNLSGVPAHVAREYIKDESNETVLARWAQSEKRPDIKALIVAKMGGEE